MAVLKHKSDSLRAATTFRFCILRFTPIVHHLKILGPDLTAIFLIKLILRLHFLVEVQAQFLRCDKFDNRQSER